MKNLQKVIVFLVFTQLFFIEIITAQAPFITTWKTDNPGGSNETSIVIPTFGEGYDYDIDWDGDGIYDEFGLTGDASYDYGVSGTYTIAIRGAFPRIRTHTGYDNEAEKLMSIEQWGDIQWSSMHAAFQNASNLIYNATDSPDLSNVTNMNNMFENASSFNGDLSNWDVSNVLHMNALFSGASSFNGNISNWDVSNVLNMGGMFEGASSFNGDISNWDVSNVLSMSRMFSEASSFNGDISNWDVGNVENMGYMFRYSSFNGDISNWDVGDVFTMLQMFEFSSFDGDISNWNVSNVYQMSNMFEGASFSGDISNWDVSNVTRMTSMFEGASFFNSDLSNWDVSNVEKMDLIFKDATSFNSDLNNWDVSGIEDMQSIFNNASSFNGNISNWDVSNVTTMKQIFSNASSFNGDISNWNVSSVGNMQLMFNNASSFNGDIGNWDVSNVTTMTQMFSNASSFNGDISNWDVSGVGNMKLMFNNASSFNIDISNWDVSNVLSMVKMFRLASSFDRDLGSWEITNILPWTGSENGLSDILKYSGLSTTNYDNTLIGWASQNVPNNLRLGADGLTYCEGGVARNILINVYGWIITGDEPDPSCESINVQAPFITTWKTDNPGNSSNTSIIIPIFPTEDYNYDIDWDGDGIYDEFGLTGSATHDYGVPGTYAVAIRGAFPRIYINDEADKEKLISIEQWGDVQWSSMESSFKGAANLVYNATDIPDISNVTSMAHMFYEASSFNGSLNSWDVSNVTDMNHMFYKASSFNRYLGGWDITNVTDMTGMLSYTVLYTSNYDGTLIGWASQSPQSNLSLGAVDLFYCEGEEARNTLINTYGWTISGDALIPTCNPTSTENLENEDNQASKIYPNPIQNILNIEFETQNEEINITISNHLGQVVHTKNESYPKGAQIESIDLSSFAEGYYFITIQNNDRMETLKFIKVK